MSDIVNDAKSAWIARVLGVSIPMQDAGSRDAGARSGPKGASPDSAGSPRPRGPVAYGTLLLEWRAAQQRAATAVAALGRTILAREDVLADPRIGQVREAVAAMPTLIPTFGEELDDLIDTAMTPGAGPQADVALAKARVVAARYRATLVAAVALERLEALATQTLGGKAEIYGALDAALAALEGEFAARIG